MWVGQAKRNRAPRQSYNLTTGFYQWTTGPNKNLALVSNTIFVYFKEDLRTATITLFTWSYSIIKSESAVYRYMQQNIHAQLTILLKQAFNTQAGRHSILHKQAFKYFEDILP